MDAQIVEKALLCAELNAQEEKRIESPLVRYNEFDQPVCRVCDIVLESESLWDAHQVSCEHRETSHRLHAIVLKAFLGMVSTASIMIGLGAIEQDIKDMIRSGFVWLVSWTCTQAIMEFQSMSFELDKKVAQMKREKENKNSKEKEEGDTNEKQESLPNPFQAAVATALAYFVGAMVPFLVAFFIREYEVGLVVVVAVVSFASIAFGWVLAVLVNAPILRFVVMHLVMGWMTMAICFGLAMWNRSSGPLTYDDW